MTLRRIEFNAHDGSIVIAGIETAIGRRLRRSELPADLSALVSSERDMRTGWTWVGLRGFALRDHPCVLSLGFFGEVLESIHWSIEVPDAVYESNWPTPATSNREIDILTEILSDAFGAGRDTQRGHSGQDRYEKDLVWGTVWCGMDMQGGAATSGLRYVKILPPSERRGFAGWGTLLRRSPRR